MGVTIDELRRRARKYDPEKEAEDQKLVEAYLKDHPEVQEGEFEEVVDAQEQDLIEAVDHLDEVYTLLCDVLTSKVTRLDKDLNYRASELCDEIGEFLEDLTGVKNVTSIH